MQIFDANLTTLEAVRVYLNITVDDRDQQLLDLIGRYSGVVSAWCERRFQQTTYSGEIYSGNGSDSLWLRAWPVTTPFATSTHQDGSTTVTHAIYEDDSRKFGAGTLLTEDEPSVTASGDYYVVAGEESQGRVVRLNGSWPRGHGNIKASYQGGYALTALPVAVVEATHRLVARAWQLSEQSAHATASQGNPAAGGSVSFTAHEIPADVKSMLQPWKRMRVV